MAVAPALRSNPVLNHNFVVSLLDSSSVLATVGSSFTSTLLDVVVGGFSECQGLEASMKIEEWNEGGNNGTVLKFPGRVSWSNITLRHGMTANSALWDWFYGFVQGQGKRRDGVIALLNERLVPSNIWYFRCALLYKYTGPQMSATQSNVAIESIEIAHEGIYQLPFVGLLGGLSDAAANGGAGGFVAATVSQAARLAG
jgi:phage tail-like protein